MKISKYSNSFRILVSLTLLVLTFVVIPVLFTYCSSDDSSPTSANPKESGIIIGMVRNTQSNMLGDVLVSAGDLTASTNEQGYFVITDVPLTDELLVHFTKDGYATTYKNTKVIADATSDFNVILKAVDISGTVSGTNGGTVSTNGGASVAFSPNSLINESGDPYNGVVNVVLTAFDPTNDMDIQACPGEFKGFRDGGSETPFSSFGIIDVDLSASGGVNLSADSTATLTIPIPSSLTAVAPSSIPLWFYDTSSGIWREDGQATRVGDTFVGDVGHFSTWTAGEPEGSGTPFTVSGRVVGPEGNPIAGARVIVSGANYQTTEPSTPSDGTFSIETVCAPAQVVAALGTMNSNTVDVTCDASMTINVGDLTFSFSPPKFQITLTWGSSPSDIDLHLAIPTAVHWVHLYYPEKGILFNGAQLNTDDTDGHGPEIISVHELHDGIYRCSIHHYSGDGTLSTSGAEVFLIINGSGLYYSLTPPTGAVAEKDVWRLWDITVSGGKVTNVNVINNYLHGVEASDIDKFIP